MIDVADDFVGVVIEKLGVRKGEMTNMKQGGDGYTSLSLRSLPEGL
jgi:GTP-binding protein